MESQFKVNFDIRQNINLVTRIEHICSLLLEKTSDTLKSLLIIAKEEAKNV